MPAESSRSSHGAFYFLEGLNSSSDSQKNAKESSQRLANCLPSQRDDKKQSKVPTTTKKIEHEATLVGKAPQQIHPNKSGQEVAGGGQGNTSRRELRLESVQPRDSLQTPIPRARVLAEDQRAQKEKSKDVADSRYKVRESSNKKSPADMKCPPSSLHSIQPSSSPTRPTKEEDRQVESRSRPVLAPAIPDQKRRDPTASHGIPERPVSLRRPDEHQNSQSRMSHTQASEICAKVIRRLRRVELRDMFDKVRTADRRGQIDDDTYLQLLDFFYCFVPMVLHSPEGDPVIARGEDLLNHELIIHRFGPGADEVSRNRGTNNPHR